MIDPHRNGATYAYSHMFNCGAENLIHMPATTLDQAETDRYWDAIVGNGGTESACGWCKDKWGLSWQITPRVLTEAMWQSARSRQ